MSKLIKRFIAVSAAILPALVAGQAQAGTVKFVTGNGANHSVCGYVMFNGGAQTKTIVLAPRSPVKEVWRFTKPNGTAYSTQFSSDCYGSALAPKHYRVNGDRTLKGF